VSVVYEAVVFEGDAPLVRAAFDRLRTPLALRLLQLADRGFALVCWTPGGRRRHAVEEVNRLAAKLSSEFQTALAVHYDDGCGVKTAVECRAGSVVRQFGDAEELWTPMDERGYPVPDGPRYPGNAIPPDVECDCIRQAIDAGLEATGFGSWLSGAELRDKACSQEH
jgi:hypothetical protein